MWPTKGRISSASAERSWRTRFLSEATISPDIASAFFLSTGAEGEIRRSDRAASPGSIAFVVELYGQFERALGGKDRSTIPRRRATSSFTAGAKGRMSFNSTSGPLQW